MTEPKKKEPEPKKPKAKVYRSPEVSERVLVFIAHGGAVKRIGDAAYVAEILEEDPKTPVPAMPTCFTVWKWVRVDDEFAEDYRKAKQFAMEVMADEVVAIADDAQNDFLERKDGSKTTDWEAVGRSKLRCEIRLKMMAMIAPKRFSPQVKAELSGADGGPVRLIIEK